MLIMLIMLIIINSPCSWMLIKQVSFQLAFSFISLSSLSEIVSLTVTWFQWRTSDEVICYILLWVLPSNTVFIKYFLNIKYESDFSMLTLKNHHFNGKTIIKNHLDLPGSHGPMAWRHHGHLLGPAQGPQGAANEVQDLPEKWRNKNGEKWR